MTATTWLAAIDASGFDGWTRAILINEAQRTRFPGDLPAGFESLAGGFADLGFENLGLDAVRMAFVGIGVVAPGTRHRLRNVRPGLSVVEPSVGGEEVALPDYWRQGVLVLGNDATWTGIGKRVPGEWLNGVDRSDRRDAGDGWVLRCRPPEPPASE